MAQMMPWAIATASKKFQSNEKVERQQERSKEKGLAMREVVS